MFAWPCLKLSSLMPFQCAVSGCMVARMFLVFVLLLATTLPGFAEVTRSVSQSAPGDAVSVEINWSLDQLEGALIVEEMIPGGWVLDGVPSVDGHDYSWRLKGSALQVAIGVGQAALPETGILTYRLMPVSVDAPDLRFAGRLHVLVSSTLQPASIAGTSSFDPLEETTSSPRIRSLWVTGIIATDPKGRALTFAVEPESARRAIASRATLAAPDGKSLPGVIYIEYSSNLLDSASWQVIHTSAPADRVVSPGRVEWPLHAPPGMLRLRWEEAP